MVHLGCPTRQTARAPKPKRRRLTASKQRRWSVLESMLGGNKPRGGSAKERSVFVGNIPYDVTEEQLKEIFSEAGSVVNFRLVTDRETGKPKGYGFCEYADGATALSAMRNLNGYEVNGRNLRVDFADGGDKSSSGGGGGGGGGSHGGGGDRGYHQQHREQFSHHQYHQQQPGVSGEMAINAIESAIAKFGPLKLYDMLVALKEHARQKPEHTKGMLSANPALTHAIVQAFKSLQIPIPSPAETQAALMQPPMVMAGRVMLPAPMQRGPPMGPPVSGILGMGPPPGPPLHSTAPPPALAPAKAGGTRWSARPGPLSTQISAPVASSGANIVVTPTASTSAGLMPTPSSGLMPTPTNGGLMPTPSSSGLMPASSAPVGGLLPPPSRSPPPPQSASSILGAPPPQASSSILGLPPQASSSILGMSPQASSSILGAPPQASSSILGVPPQASSSILGAPPQASSSILGAPQTASSILGPPPTQLPAASRNRDPRRAARDPRLAKRGFEAAAPSPLVDPVKRQKPMDHGPPASSNGAEFDAIAELARDMTPEKLDMLPPEERQMLVAFMQQNNIPFHGR